MKEEFSEIVVEILENKIHSIKILEQITRFAGSETKEFEEMMNDANGKITSSSFRMSRIGKFATKAEITVLFVLVHIACSYVTLETLSTYYNFNNYFVITIGVPWLLLIFGSEAIKYIKKRVK